MKTLKEWAEYLSEEERIAFINNFDQYYRHRSLENKVDSLHEAINSAFQWSKSHEGRPYWVDIHHKAKNGYYNQKIIGNLEIL